MGIKRGLLFFLLRQTWPATLIAVPAACMYSLLKPDLLHGRDPWPAVFILVHSLILTALLGRFRTAGFAFLCTRGYSRHSLWGHTMLASLLAVLAAWGPAAVILWGGLRSRLQQALLSPYFPVMAPREAPVPLVWLAGYALLLPAFHYAWIRQAQPTRGRDGGVFLAVGLVVAVFSVIAVDPAGWFRWPLWAAAAATALVLLAAGRRLHQRMEVGI